MVVCNFFSVLLCFACLLDHKVSSGYTFLRLSRESKSFAISFTQAQREAGPHRDRPNKYYPFPVSTSHRLIKAQIGLFRNLLYRLRLRMSLCRLGIYLCGFRLSLCGMRLRISLCRLGISLYGMRLRMSLRRLGIYLYRLGISLYGMRLRMSLCRLGICLYRIRLSLCGMGLRISLYGLGISCYGMRFMLSLC